MTQENNFWKYHNESDFIDYPDRVDAKSYIIELTDAHKELREQTSYLRSLLNQFEYEVSSRATEDEAATLENAVEDFASAVIYLEDEVAQFLKQAIDDLRSL